MKEIVFLYIIAGLVPTAIIYYFTKGNWPLAFNLQLGLLFILFIASVAMVFLSLNSTSSGRNSNPIGSAGAIIGFILLIIPLILAIGAVAFSYKGIPASEPGILNKPIKWSATVLFGSAIVMILYNIIYNNLYTQLYRLPNFLKQPIYASLITKDLSYRYKNQLRESFKAELQSSGNISSVLTLIKNRSFLYDLFNERNPDPKLQHINIYRLKVLNELRETISQTGYPDANIMSDLVYRISNMEVINVEVLLKSLDCLKILSSPDKHNTSYLINDENLLTSIWEQYPEYRASYLPGSISLSKSFIQKRVKKGDKLPDINKTLKNLIRRQYPDESTYNMLHYFFTNHSKQIIYSDGVLHKLATSNNEWTYKLLYEIDFPDSVWKIKYNDKDILNYFITDNDIRIKIRFNSSNTNEDKLIISQILRSLQFLQKKGMTKITNTNDEHDITARVLLDKHKLKGFTEN